MVNIKPYYILEESLSSQYLMPVIERIKNNKISHNDTDLEDYLRTYLINKQSWFILNLQGCKLQKKKFLLVY